MIITATGKKGALPKRLNESLQEKLSSAPDLDPGLIELLELGKSAANRAISRAPKGASISAQILLTDDPYGGWGLSVTIDATPSMRGRKG